MARNKKGSKTIQTFNKDELDKLEYDPTKDKWDRRFTS